MNGRHDSVLPHSETTTEGKLPCEPSQKRNRKTTPTRTGINNTDPVSEDAKRVRSYAASYLAGSSDKRRGKLVITPSGFSFTAASDRPGWPSVRGSFGSRHNPFVREGSTLTIRAENGRYRFELTPNDLDDIEFIALERQESLERISPYASSIADGCINDSWPNVTHPFFERHASTSTNRAAVFELIGWQFLTQPLRWDAYDISIEHASHELLVKAKQGGTVYRYTETPASMRVSYDSESVGFFDDSEHSESASCTFEHVGNPDRRIEAQACDVHGLRGNERDCYLRNPFGMKGIFRLVRTEKGFITKTL